MIDYYIAAQLSDRGKLMADYHDFIRAPCCAHSPALHTALAHLTRPGMRSLRAHLIARYSRRCRAALTSESSSTHEVMMSDCAPLIIFATTNEARHRLSPPLQFYCYRRFQLALRRSMACHSSMTSFTIIAAGF